MYGFGISSITVSSSGYTFVLSKDIFVSSRTQYNGGCGNERDNLQ
jgi:hypothetical protein